MLIRARLFGNLKERMSKRWMTMEVAQGGSVRDFVLELAKITDLDPCEILVEKKDKIRPEIKILLNGRNITHLRGLETELKDRDLVSILTIVGGG